MIGTKLFLLAQELNPILKKTLIQKCGQSSDKRLLILKEYLLSEIEDQEVYNQFLKDKIAEYWSSSSPKEQALKERRMSNFFAEQIEKVVLENYLESNPSIKPILLSQAFEKSGNLSLLKYYYDKAYQKSIQDRDFHYQMLGLKGKIRMSYASQNEKELSKAVELNEELLRVLRHANNDKVTEYYYNLSNVYIEKHSLIVHRKEEIEAEILAKIADFEYSLNRASLYVSLAKLNFNNEKLEYYFSIAKEILYSTENKNHDFYDLDRKIRFLELRLLFFTGASHSKLLALSNEIVQHFESFSIINNNTLFYKILFLILNNELEEAENWLSENHIFFKGESKLLENFLLALLADKKGDAKKALKILHPIMYTTNYFFEIFARLLVIKIQIQRNKATMIKSLVTSTNRLIAQNQDNPLGREANLYVLNKLKSNYIRRTTELKLPDNFSILHQYILEGV
jgi:hypothetical protein